ncbi:hypothetical protein DM01DRAFT_1077899 [Hesseltinella vesiculosa]|uniref:RRM domain-containing protein n=1 Tax=Hesseltinella vesiculosa TaxID=101127 RepID=A0A1X2GWP2_9FUNG|nr:hypothetical protein DM01DRAFT_1077899 [Hesseltinella vesiculosa]
MATVPSQDSTSVVQKRIYAGGLPPTTTVTLIQDRFGKFGTLTSIDVAKDQADQCRGFAHFTIDTTPKQWNSCMSIYHGSTWKGHKLRLEEAAPTFEQREQIKKGKELLQLDRKRRRQARCPSGDGIFAKDMSLVTDNNVNTRSGKWKRGRYGRAIAVMRLAKEDGTRFVFDPTHYKNNLEKLFNVGGRMKRTADLPVFYEDFEQQAELEVMDDEPQAMDWQGSNNDDDRHSLFNDSDNDQGHQDTTDRPALFQDSDQEDTHSRPALFEDSDQDQDEGEPRKDAKWMFDSDEEDDDGDLDIRINPVLEGEKGRQRLELQSKFKGDDRFKLDEEFMDDDEDEDTHAPDTAAASMDDVTKGLAAEKDQSMDVLRSMFGDVQVFTPTKQANTWAASARYDPEAEDASQYLTKQASDHEGSLSDVSDRDDQDLAPTRTESAVPEVSKDKHFSVNVNLKPLFSATDEPFTLFGADGVSEDEEPSTPPPDVPAMDATQPSFLKSATTSQSMELSSLFFYHDDSPDLIKKSCYLYDPHGIFQRQEDNWEETEKEWRTNRVIISQVLKKRDKNATRMQQKLASKDLK